MIMPIQINNETYLNNGEAMRMLGISKPTLYTLVNNGTLAQYKQGFRQTPYYKLTDLERLQEMRRSGQDDDSQS